MKTLRPFIFGTLVAVGSTAVPNTLMAESDATPAPALKVAARERLPAVKLRAYGTLSGERTTFADSPQASLLRVTCESQAKAHLVLAKYLSDLGLLPGVTALPLASSRGPLAARQVEGQGVVVAIRSGKQVSIFTAADSSALRALVEDHVSWRRDIDASEAEIPVPMFVDRWDKHGFRFYYGPFVKPQDAEHRDVPVYDPKQDFAFAKQSGDVGLVLWNVPARNPRSEGIMDINSRQWVFDAAKKLGLPLGINIGIEDANLPLINRHPDDMVPNADGYLGGWYGAMNFGGTTTAWSSDPVQEIALGQIQSLVRDLSARYSNIVNWLEPHEEMVHGVCDLVDDHGPSAKANFHKYLKAKYGSPAAVAKRWSQPGAFKTWDDVPFPELATFLGWNAGALDLTGTWKMSFEASYGADSAKADLDDSSWNELQAPGHAIVRSIPRKPAVFRRHFKMDAAWRSARPKVWLYLWDFNDTRRGGDDTRGKVYVFMNGAAIPEAATATMGEHACALEVTQALVDGDNVLTVCLPQAMIDYRCYLSGEAPAVYPGLGPRLNAQWADFSDWTCWSRGQAVRRGAQMIRQVDPDRPITLMSPDLYLSPIKAVAEDYGGIIHDTGGMAGSWGDYSPTMMQSSGLPTDCEPGSGAVDLNDFKRFMGRWCTECTQGIDYFQHIGDLTWKPEVKEYFGKTLNLWHLIGKYHLPHAELAILNSDRNLRLLGFPWDVSRDPNVVFSENRWWALINQVLPLYLRAGILEDDFARGNVDQYRVVLDGNTTIMDTEIVDQIEKWVRRGGTFITYQQTGRHTSAVPNSWPIAKLTGYSVTGIDKLALNGDGRPSRHLHPVDGQTVFNPAAPGWQYVQNSAGLSLQKHDPACVDLLQWDDGAMAAGLRKLGKGMVITLGSNSSALVPQVLEWLRVRPVSGSTGNRDIVTRHFVSNNGLYDVWVLWNSKVQPVTATLTFSKGIRPAVCHDVNTGETIPIDGSGECATLPDLALESWQTRAFLTPRGQLAHAPLEWFALQRAWWKGTADTGAPIPAYKAKLAVNLTEDWAFKPLEGPVTGTPPEDAALADPKLDDSAWPRRQIGIFDIPDYPDVRHAMYRKRFTVPADWNHGRVLLDAGTDTLGGGGSRQYLDGQRIDVNTVNDKFGRQFTPGSTHLLAVEIWNPNAPVGTREPIFISYRPDALSRQPLRDNWAFASNYLKYAQARSLPLETPVIGALRTVAKIDAAQAGRAVVVHTVTSNGHQHRMVFNGHHLPCNGNYDTNVTPWVKFGQDNEIIVVCDTTVLQDASIDFYDAKAYP